MENDSLQLNITKFNNDPSSINSPLKKNQLCESRLQNDNLHPIQNILSAELKGEGSGRNVKKALISAEILKDMLEGKSSSSSQASHSSNTYGKQLQCNKQFYLCAPDFLELKYVINPWMDLSSPFSVEKAKSQWEELVAIYQKLVPSCVNIVNPEKGLTELCFFGDSVFAYKNKAVYGRFATEERFPETEYVMKQLSERGIEGKRVPENMSYEGSGETMVWNNKILVGYGVRNSKQIVKFLEEQFEIDVIGLELIDPEFYHLDTALFPISNNLIAVFEDAFSEESKQIIKSLGCEIIYLGYKDAKEFALNSIAIGKNVIVHYEAENFISILKEKGFQVSTVDISEFIKFGGGLKCLTFQHYLE